ncbi:MAG TPA: hypothetical protein VI231_10635 [Candidatus Binatia bacterium]
MAVPRWTMGDALSLASLTVQSFGRFVLTLLKFRSYTCCVQCRIIAAAFLGVWLVLIAGDFCDDLGLFDDDNNAVDQALDVALADLGQAVDISAHSHAAAWVAARDDFRAAQPALLPAPFLTNETLPTALSRASPAAGPTNHFRERSTVLLL